MKLGTDVPYPKLLENFEGDTPKSHVNADISTFSFQYQKFQKLHELYINGKEISCGLFFAEEPWSENQLLMSYKRQKSETLTSAFFTDNHISRI